MARVRRDPASPRWPSWRYGPSGEAAIFQTEEEVPFGWTAKAGQVFVPPTPAVVLDREDIANQLLAKNITPHPTWSVAYMKEVLDR